MGKASRRKQTATTGSARPATLKPAAYAARPFKGLPGESDWVAMAEILPAATLEVPLADGVGGEDGPTTVTIATVLPMAWPALRRGDGAVLVATQGGGGSGDHSRDLASALLAALAVEPGTPIATVPLATDDTPPLQDLVALSGPPEVVVHEGFDFWVEGQDLDADAKDSLERANSTAVPTARVEGAPSAYWCLLGTRPHLRVVLGEDEDDATNALARLLAAGTAGLGEGTRLLGAFRACGLLIPVWELPAGTEAADCTEPLAEFATRYAAAVSDEPLAHEERRARAGLLNRQVTLR